jgi:hypothetical protein
MPKWEGDKWEEELRLEREKFDNSLDNIYTESKREPITTVGNGMINELVKSYGFSRSQGGEWDWSLDTIGKAWKESPFWTAVDWAALAYTPLKWGTSVRAVQKGIGIAGKALAAGEFANAKPATQMGRAVGMIVGKETAKAAELYRAGPSRLFFKSPSGKFEYGLSSPITPSVKGEYMALVDKYGAEHGVEAYERRAITSSYRKELVLEKQAADRQVGDIVTAIERLESQGKVLPHHLRNFSKMMEGGVPADSPHVLRAMWPELAVQYGKAAEMRNVVHEAGFQWGFLSKATHARNNQKYWPRVNEMWDKVNAGIRKMRGSTPIASKAAQAPEAGAVNMFKHRKEGAFSELADPRVGVAKLGEAMHMIAGQKFAEKLASSSIAATTDDLHQLVAEIIETGNWKLGAMHGLTKTQMAGLRSFVDDAELVGKDYSSGIGEEIASHLGWRTIDEMFTGKKVPEFLERVPEELRGMRLDPAAAHDVIGMLKAYDDPSIFTGLYQGIMGLFRVGKTAYNPPTLVRNAAGAAIFHHFVTGGSPFKSFKRGRRALQEKGEAYDAMREAGVVGSQFTVEFQNAVAATRTGGQSLTKSMKIPTALWFLGERGVMKYIQKGAGKAEELYRYIDEVAKADAWLRQTAKHQARGLSLTEARSLATLDLNKFTPQFAMHSDLANSFRSWIPFASFTTESLRVYKNLLNEKPHIAFFWNHFMENLSQGFGAMAGYTPDQINEFQQNLPHYMKNKKQLMLPFNVDGQPRFIDASYMIPMANLVEGEQAESLFFGEVIDYTANPLLNMAAVAATGKDPFSGRDIGPDFTERQLGIPVPNLRMRKTIGLAEHAAKLLLPPLVPPGYAGVNLLEMARGQVHPKTGEKLEDSVLKTLLANLAGVRTYAPDVEAMIGNEKNTQRMLNKRMTLAWRRWETARANGDLDAMKKEQFRVMSLRKAGGHADASKYFEAGIKRRKPFANLSTKQLKEILAKADEQGALSTRDKRVRAELMSRLQSRRNK